MYCDNEFFCGILYVLWLLHRIKLFKSDHISKCWKNERLNALSFDELGWVVWVRLAPFQNLIHIYINLWPHYKDQRGHCSIELSHFGQYVEWTEEKTGVPSRQLGSSLWSWSQLMSDFSSVHNSSLLNYYGFSVNLM